MIIKGDCIEEMKKLDENSVDAIITDPPYDLSKPTYGFERGKQDNPYGRTVKGGFMGKQWDGTQVAFKKETWIEALRILKPGGYILAFGGTRTYHRMTCGIEDAGFEIRDCIMWIYGSGFPKSLNIGKQIDKIQGNEREVLGKKPHTSPKADNSVKASSYGISGGLGDYAGERIHENITKGNSEWEGWGTALKPACEPIVVARKPLSEKNVALNVLKWGTGGINIDACRIGTETLKEHKAGNIPNDRGKWGLKEGYVMPERQGRFPANIILDEEAGEILDEQSGILSQGHWSKTKTTGFGEFGGGSSTYEGVGEKDKTKHGASRFFYCAKASKSERNFGCEEMEEKLNSKMFRNANNTSDKISDGFERFDTLPSKNNHPTVKPIKLMEYLIKLVSKENSIVLDPFTGSGTTGIACVKLNRQFIGFEKEEEYVKIAEARIKPYLEQRKL